MERHCVNSGGYVLKHTAITAPHTMSHDIYTGIWDWVVVFPAGHQAAVWVFMCASLLWRAAVQRAVRAGYNITHKKRKIKPNHWLHLFVNCSRFTPMKQRFTIHFNVMQNTLWVLFIFNFCCTVPIMYKSVWNLTDIIVFSRPQPPPPPNPPARLFSVLESRQWGHTHSHNSGFTFWKMTGCR